MKAPNTLQVSCVQTHWAKSLERNLERTLHYVRQAAEEGSRVLLFPETSLTGYYFPDVIKLAPAAVRDALDQTRRAAKEAGIWVIAGTLRKTAGRFLNLAHVISPRGSIVHEYAKVHLAGRDEKRYCRGGNKLSLFEIDGVPCTLAICRDGRHPEVYRLPAMLGARVLFHPSCSSDEVEAVIWKRYPAGPSQPGKRPDISLRSQCRGQSPDEGRLQGPVLYPNPTLPLAAGYYKEEMISAVLDLERADRRYALDSLSRPAFLRPYWRRMLRAVGARTDRRPA
jgi:hypothetical protein